MPSTTLTPYIDPDVARTAAKAYAKAHGEHGGRGGWIYDAHGRALTQGWDSYEAAYYVRIRDWVTAQVTAFDTFQALIDTNERYSPTLLARRGWRERYVADHFDLRAYQLGQGRRAWRGSPLTRRCAAWRDCGNLAVPLSERSFRGFCPSCESIAQGGQS